MKVMASPMPTRVRASRARTKESARANPTWARVITTAPVRMTLRGPKRSTSSPTGTCMPAYTISCSIVNVASCAAVMSKRSAASRPATASEERWKTAKRYSESALPHTTQEAAREVAGLGTRPLCSSSAHPGVPVHLPRWPPAA